MKLIHSAGKRIILITAVALIAIVLAVIFLIKILFLSISVSLASLVILVLVLRFFRIPSRAFTNEINTVVAPADGKVVVIERTSETEYHNSEMIQVSIFMSIHNVHINWVPLQGKVLYYKYHPGSYLLARHPKSSSLNERSSLVIGNGKKSIMVRQIAGYVARRILTFIKEGDEVSYGTEMGFIRFGSRLDLFLPLNAEILVKQGEMVTGGVSPIAIL